MWQASVYSEQSQAKMREALGIAFAAALASLFVVLLGLVLLRHWWQRRGAVPASNRGGFVLFDVCLPDDRRLRRAARTPSVERSRWRAPRESGDSEAAAAVEAEPDECEIARWKKIFGGPARCLSTIETRGRRRAA